METKPFFLTSEFWITVAVMVTAVSGVIPDVSGKYKALGATIAAAAYAISRGLAKNGVPFYGKPDKIPSGILHEGELEDGDVDVPVKA